MRRLALVAAALFAAVPLTGCMEVEQTSVTADKPVGQTVKRDTAAWANEPLGGGPKWTKGDRGSWEEQLKNRQLAQHEHRRIYQ
jgi:hypothetical protein